jgi:hypothetical protein
VTAFERASKQINWRWRTSVCARRWLGRLADRAVTIVFELDVVLVLRLIRVVENPRGLTDSSALRSEHVIDHRAKEQREVRQPQPCDKDDDATGGAIGRLVAIKVVEIETC